MAEEKYMCSLCDIQGKFENDICNECHSGLPDLPKKATETLKPTGTRHNAGKAPVSMVLEASHALKGCAQVLAFGAAKYDRGNWRNGLKHTEVCDSLIRHLTTYLAGEDKDEESGLPHVDHILCNALFLAELTHTHPELDTRSTAKPK